jgi:hypothetical protein
MLPGNKLLVTLNNYDNNRYSQIVNVDSTENADTLTATFADITMANKPADSPTFQIILNKQLTIDAPYKEYYSTYRLDLQGADCDQTLPQIKNPAPPRPDSRLMNQN